ncbi:MAG: copper resistance protein CopC [Leucobacter sp.]
MNSEHQHRTPRFAASHFDAANPEAPGSGQSGFATAHASAPRFVRPRALAIAALAAIGLTLGAAAPALAHDELTGYSIAESGSDVAFELTFSNEIMEVGSEIVVTADQPAGDDSSGNNSSGSNTSDDKTSGDSGENVAEGDPVVEGRSVTQTLRSDLADGDYTALWRVVSSDGHPIQGALTLTIDGGGLTDIALAENAEGTENTENPDDGDSGYTSAEDLNEQAGEAGQAGPNTLLPVAIGGAALIVVAAAVLIGSRRRARGMRERQRTDSPE